MYKGIDYSLGQANIDRETNIHYGVISQHSIMPDALGDFEYIYPGPNCPYCGSEHLTNGDDINGYFECKDCHKEFDNSEAYGDDPIGFEYNQDGYVLTDCLDNDIFVLKSPYYTFTQFCSPCVPGAGNLDTPIPDGVKTYALGHDWFDDGKAPYPLYSVETGLEVLPN
jgi:hypothetical protein